MYQDHPRYRSQSGIIEAALTKLIREAESEALKRMYAQSGSEEQDELAQKGR